MTNEVLTGLDRFPRSRDIHLLADYVELLCLSSSDQVVAKADVLDRWSERTDVGEDPDAGGPAATGGTAAVHDRRTLVLDDVFRHLSYRIESFAESYPFKLTAMGSLERRSRLSLRRKLYVFLLLAASLRYVQPTDRRSLTTAFERFSAEAIREWLTPAARVYLFGTSAPPSSRYRGKLFKKLRRLADDLYERLHLQEQDFRPGDAGDAGADIVAWLPFADETSSLGVFFAQATCQADWIAKQHESGQETWRPIMTFTAPHNNVICIPYCFRDGTGSWAYRREIHQSILLDRVRLAWLMRDMRGAVSSVPYALVNRALAFRETAV